MENLNDKIIDGKLFEKMIISGAGNLKANVKIVNDLNVFPVPDGDTGDNMYMTIRGGLESMKNCDDDSISQKAKALASGMLLGARGNSGVILSQLFAGLSDGLLDFDKVSVVEFAKALKCGVCKAYGAVAKPVEGTILTVARETADFVCEKCGDSSTIGEFFACCLVEMRRSLDHTPDLLETLNKAGVIDSGGAGLLYIVEGMKRAVDGEEIAVTEDESDVFTVNADIDPNMELSLNFGYCTELTVKISKEKQAEFSLDKTIEFLEGIGESVVAFLTDGILKLHVHTSTPCKVMEYCHNFGEFVAVKVENMDLQHNGVKTAKKKQKPRTDFAVVTVASGSGLIKTFCELGADVVIDGGQSKNPSIERFIDAFDEANADTIFVLPNNSNIIMGAKQASETYKKSKIIVIETKNIGQAYSIISMLDYSSNDAETIKSQMLEDMSSVVTGMVTVAVRDANIDGVEIKEGEYIGFEDKTMLSSTTDKIETLFELAQKLEINSKNFMILCYGKDVTEQEKVKIRERILAEYSTLEFYEIDGEQEVYNFIMILE